MDSSLQLCGIVRPYFGRSQVQNDVAEASQPPAAVSPVTPRATNQDTPANEPAVTLERLQQIAHQQLWTAVVDHQACHITVPVASNRKQSVSIRIVKHPSANTLWLSFVSRCGPASAKNSMVLLRRNARLFDTAYAVVNEGGRDIVLLRSVQSIEQATMSDIVATIESIAQHADRVESKLVDVDHY